MSPPVKLVEELFEYVRAHTAWNIDAPMLWSYFFKNESPDELETAAAELEQLGYRYIDITVRESKEEEFEIFFLQVDKEETHSLESLIERNLELDAFAEKHHLNSYGGMEVRPIQT